MRILSTNIGEKREVMWRGQTFLTGIYKEEVDKGIFLDLEDVRNDHVIDRRYHGGVDKACYLYSYDHYVFWKEKFPDLDWKYGMFGENLTVEGLDERKVRIGDVFSIGETQVQVTQPRQPCFKLGVRFNDPSIIKQFINTSYSGIYVRVLQAGLVKTGTALQLEASDNLQPTVAEVFYAKYHHG